GGLQDSAPRAALLALHARVEDVAPNTWEDPSLVQIWFRWSDYVVPRADVGVFTRGALPRDQQQVDALEALAEEIVGVLDGGRADSREVAARLPRDLPPFAVRLASPTGRIHIRWDASRVEVMAAPPPSIDDESARLELARRFLHWLGPADAKQFSKWTKVSQRDAKATFAALADELAPVTFAGRRCWLLAGDVDDLVEAVPPKGVRLLPMGDPCLYLGDDQPPSPSPQPLDAAAKVTKRLVNSFTGRVVVDGEVVGAWGRVKGDVTLDPWPTLGTRYEADVEREAASFAGPIGAPIRSRWLPRRR
ncbi:MAG: winged helix DNA-binding domain-containing protein, partial [Actinobacteria bacterium]|nr:winged helix DNA-binding domain-containing protein [Actinomycetota bacterium]